MDEISIPQQVSQDGWNATVRDAAERAARVAALRRKLAGMTAEHEAEVLPVPTALAPLFPRGGLPRGSVVSAVGAGTVPVALLAEASARGAAVALVGLPEVNLAAAVDLGADLDRIAVVPIPGVRGSGADALEVAAVLLDGIDLVVVGIGDAAIAPSRARVLSGRARKQSATLLVIGDWPAPTLRIAAEVSEYRHLPLRRNGSGRIGGYRMAVQVSGSGMVRRSRQCDLLATPYGGSGADAKKAPLLLVAADSSPAVAAVNGRIPAAEGAGKRAVGEDAWAVAN